MYFEKFPLLTYTLDDGTTFQLTTDIFVRVGFLSSVINNIVFYEEVDVVDGDTPEIIADKVYGNSTYHWVILLANQIVDPILDWVMTPNQLFDYVSDKYGVDSVYTTHHYEDEFGAVVEESVVGAYPVSNLEYENVLNESKRRIKVPKVEALSQIVKEFKNAISK